MKAGGTIRVKPNKTIKKGEEILFAYHQNYWRRWGQKRPGRPAGARASTEGETGAVPARQTEPAQHYNDESPQVMLEQNGVRMIPDLGNPPRGRKRGRPAKEKTDDLSSKCTHKRQTTKFVWSTTGRDEFDRQQQQWSARYERGEGGGVT